MRSKQIFEGIEVLLHPSSKRFETFVECTAVEPLLTTTARCLRATRAILWCDQGKFHYRFCYRFCSHTSADLTCCAHKSTIKKSEKCRRLFGLVEGLSDRSRRLHFESRPSPFSFPFPVSKPVASNPDNILVDQSAVFQRRRTRSWNQIAWIRKS